MAACRPSAAEHPARVRGLWAPAFIEPGAGPEQVRGVPLKGSTILVVDDDEAQREVLVEILDLEGVRTLAASTADEAVALLEEGPDLVMMDLRGVEVGSIMRAIEGLPGRPVLMIVSGDVRLAQIARDLGADACLAKPYELDQLLTALSQALDDRAGASGPSPA